MASVPFRVANWSPEELISKEKLDQMNSNMVWLRDNTPRAYYTLPSGIRRVEGLRIAAGRVMIGATNSDSASAMVYFNNLFSSGCQPIITTGIVSSTQRKIFAVVNGISQLHPDNRGFQVRVNVAAGLAKNDKIARSFYIAWQAVGY